MNNLKKIRGKQGLSAKELSQKLGVSRQFLWYNENKTISLSLALRAAKILNVNVFEILGKDAFVLTPKTDEDIEIVIKNIKE